MGKSSKRGIANQRNPLLSEITDRLVRAYRPERVYRFGSDGLPSAVLSQGKPWLNRPMALEGMLGGRPAAWEVAEKFAFTGTKPAEVRGRAALRSGDLNVAVESVTEYDGLIRLRVTYGPARGSVALDRLRLKAPLAGARCLFYSADGKERVWRPDGKGPGYCYDLLPAKQGTVFDSTERPQTAGLPAMFTGLFWLADNETCFCYAADTDEGWLIRDDAPSVEAVREGDDVVLRVGRE